MKAALILINLLFLFSLASFGQEGRFPDKIRGYKVHRANVTINTGSDSNENADISAKFGEAALADLALTGFTLEMPISMVSHGQSAKIDFLDFKDFKVNGIAVYPEEYTSSFELPKKEEVVFPKPIRIFVRFSGALRGAIKEWRDSKETWKVSGRIFVFGKFRKALLYHKRVVPIDIDLEIANPAKKAASGLG